MKMLRSFEYLKSTYHIYTEAEQESLNCEDRESEGDTWSLEANLTPNRS